MSRPGTIKRSYSTSHAHALSYSVTHTVPSLGQGATVVRTPADATMCMAQPGATTQSNPWPYRQLSLREKVRRPSAPTPSPAQPAPSPALALPDIDSSTLELLNDINDIHTRHSKKMSFSNPFKSSSKPPSPAPSIGGAVVDADAEYQRRLASRTSGSTITPNRHTAHSSTSASPGSRTSPLPYTHQPTISRQASNRSLFQADLFSGHPQPQPRDYSDEGHTRMRSSPRGVHRPLAAAPSPPPAAPPVRPPLTRSSTMPSKHAASSSLATITVSPKSLSSPKKHAMSSSIATSTISPTSLSSSKKHAPSASVSTLAPPATAPMQPFVPILVSHTNRVAPGASMVLVTLRFSYSLDPDPNTHEVTVTLDTLRPAGGRLVAFLDHTLRPHSLQSSSSGTSAEGGSTPPLSMEGAEMTDCSSTEDSDFEYDDTRLHPMLRDEYLVALALASSPGPSPKTEHHPVSSNTSPPSRTISRQPSRRGLGPPPTAYPAGLGYGTPLPSLSALPAALAQARAEREAAAAADTPHCITPPLTIRRPRSNTCPGPTKGTITELTVLLQRDASAWHTIASRLCSGSWPELAGRRRRVEDECRWAGMDDLLAELQRMPTLSRRGGFV